MQSRFQEMALVYNGRPIITGSATDVSDVFRDLILEYKTKGRIVSIHNPFNLYVCAASEIRRAS